MENKDNWQVQKLSVTDQPTKDQKVMKKCRSCFCGERICLVILFSASSLYFCDWKKTNKFNMFPVDFAYIWAYSHINLKVGVIFIDQSRPDQKQLITRDWFEKKTLFVKANGVWLMPEGTAMMLEDTAMDILSNESLGGKLGCQARGRPNLDK